MKRKLICCVIAAFSLSASSVAFAQSDRGRDDHGDRAPHDQRDDPGRGNGRDGGDHGPGRDRPSPAPRLTHHDDHHDGHGAGPDHNFYQGGRLPPQWRSRQYVVDDWRGHRLSAPPRGYHWVQTGGDYVLVAITTGIIASILLNP